MGSKLHGGRWNPKGYPLLYTAESKALAALETLVHLERNTVPDDLQIISLQLPDNQILVYDKSNFKNIINHKNSISRLKKSGQKWIDSNKSLALIVPSVLIPDENNILINPAHPSFGEIKVIDIDNFIFDDRFFI